jgi:hypothetical protein
MTRNHVISDIFHLELCSKIDIYEKIIFIVRVTLSSSAEADYREFEILKKIQLLDRLTSYEKSELIKFIINDYLKYKSAKYDPQKFNNPLTYLKGLIDEEQFREFTFNVYKIFVYYESKAELLYIVRVRDEILSAIKNRGALTDDRLLEQIRLITRSCFNDRTDRGFQGYITGVLSILPLALSNIMISF